MRSLRRISHLTVAGLLICSVLVSCQQQQQQQQQTQPISSRAAFLRAQRASRQQQQQQNQSSSTPSEPTTNINKPLQIETSKPAVVSSPINPPPPPPQSPAPTNQIQKEPHQHQQQQQNQHHQHSSNRTTRTADIFQNGEGYNIFVTNTCEPELMHVNIKTSRPFNGVIHTRNQRNKSMCTVEGNNETEFNLDISHVLNNKDPNYCGVVKARRESPEDKDQLSVVIAVRVHRNIELSDDKFFLLNCTNRCRNADCSPPKSADLTANDEVDRPRPGSGLGSGEVEGDARTPGGKPEECTVWKFPWLITLLWCMGILLVAMTISHCIMCSSLVCRWVKTEVEEREPSVYEGATTDDEDSLYNKKTHPLRIDYDNRDIYKTSNNYAPYDLDEVQAKARRSRRQK